MKTERSRGGTFGAIAVVLGAVALAGVSTAPYKLEFDKYHNYGEMTDFLANITDQFPGASTLYSVGKSILSTYKKCPTTLSIVRLTTVQH